MSFFSKVFSTFRDDSSPAAVPWLIIGLGNPGAEYASTRHNVGYMAVDNLLGTLGARQSRDTTLVPDRDANALVFATQLSPNVPVIIARAGTYMNQSGESIGALARKFKIPAEQVIVIHDELDLPAGRVRLKRGGGENGHNGLKSTTEHLGTRDYVRIRVGIGRPPSGETVIDHVLASFNEEDQAWLPEATKRAAEGAYLIATEGLAKAQNEIHVSPNA